MLPIRKPFFLDPIFPFEMVYKGLRYSESELPDHLHDLYEVVYVHKGKGMFFIDDALYEKKQGDLFLIPGNTVHRAFPSANDPIVSTAIFFAPTLLQADSLGDGYELFRCFEIARKKKHYQINLSKQVRLAIETAINAMKREINAKDYGYRHALRLHLQHMLLVLSRHPFHIETSSNLKGIGPQWLRNALQDIDCDPIGCSGLSELSGKACVSPSHFARVFKQLTGMHVTDYVNAKRLARAKDLLQSTDDNVETIALACGFQGMRHFYQIFKKLTGLTPRAYRLQMK
ncbi:AraC family transcriptional regulator [Paenibacillus pectinilyticus]|uniref:AraC family transcriptional regulator n=1 Tax=Paenibacillus pectinilyticus TaxID=512399 RepID=A0A1C0ZWV1_9BACL|nr:AraC family transcriptional regulator [Paenibacillus pectinilyticus]OCT12576.1 AraC family transcriptional regulator [Paenibacillus pectinilyticus]